MDFFSNTYSFYIKMINLKTKEEIAQIKEANILVSQTLALVGKNCKEGISTLELDRLAEEFIRDNGALPAFKGYGGFPGTLCTSVNDVIVHGIPSDKIILKPGDIVSIDCGTIKNGFFGDSAYTFQVGEIEENVSNLLRTTKEALFEGVKSMKIGNRVGDISYAVQQYSEARGCSVVREMVGHGIGRNLHEDPQVPNYGRRGSGPKITEGMVLCIEPMINLGRRNIKFDRDGWTCRTTDGKHSAHFELCVAIVDGKTETLSTFSYIDQAGL